MTHYYYTIEIPAPNPQFFTCFTLEELTTKLNSLLGKAGLPSGFSKSKIQKLASGRLLPNPIIGDWKLERHPLYYGGYW